MESKKFETEIAGRTLTIETGRLANQANASVTARYGDTLVLATVVMSPEAKEGMSYFPLMVDYEEKFYASGKIKGSRFIKREGRPTDEAILTSRLIDRSLRPLFDQSMRNEIQVILTVLSIDQENDPAIVAIIAASAALTISDIPWAGPIGAVRVGEKNEQLIINPKNGELSKSKFDIVVSGIEEKVNMIEAKAKEAPEEKILEAINLGKSHACDIARFIKNIQKEIGLEKRRGSLIKADDNFAREIKDLFSQKIHHAIYQKDHANQSNLLRNISNEVEEHIKLKHEKDFAEKKEEAFLVLDEEMDRFLHEGVLKEDRRPDGRKLDEVREITCQAGVLPRTHGNGLFARGETQVLSVVTLGSPGDEQILDTMELDEKKRFMHHYNFPPYSTGEVKPMRGPGRREIGHGALAEKALESIIPNKEIFPYTIRLVSEVLSSNGSSSMASVCASSIALMDAGVPIKSPVGGVAMGIIAGKNGEYKILSDIQGPEDCHGDMDFKIAGSKNGITALQLDVKIEGVTSEMIADTLKQSRRNRLEILNLMTQAIGAPRKELSPYAPRVTTIKINPEKIRDVIGPGGKIINQIIDETGVSIDIEDDGSVFITSENKEAGEKASQWIKNLTHEVKIGEVFSGRVARIMNFGAFVEILPGQEGLLHISEISDKRIRSVHDVLKTGDIVLVKVKEIDELGRINLTSRGLTGNHQFHSKEKSSPQKQIIKSTL